MKSGIRKFFAYARERHEVALRKNAGLPRPWTKDKILGHYRFCCVFREMDKTTIWLRENVRKKYAGRPEIVPATVLFRLFNRIETGEAMFNSGAFDAYLESSYLRPKLSLLQHAILEHCGDNGPYVTGSYIIAGPPGQPDPKKLNGMLKVFSDFYRGEPNWRGVAMSMEQNKHRGRFTLEMCWKWLRQFPYFGDFHSYEMTTDMRHTYLLKNAQDIMTWANPGPGANRGANRVFGRDVDQRNSKEQLNEEMRELLHAANTSSDAWPETNKLWPRWEMRDVEHTLCEFDKYERARLGQGRPRGVYR